jgi:hypothetical protein
MDNYFSLSFKENNIKEAQTSSGEIRGPSVDQLISAFHNMSGRGAPVIYDDIGFNKMDYGSPLVSVMLSKAPGNSLSIQLAVSALRLLYKYKKTQIPYYDQMVVGIQQLINQVKGQANIPQQGASPNKVLARGSNVYGSLLYYIPNLGRKLGIIRKAVEEAMSVQKDFRESWKIFGAASREGIDIYAVVPKYLEVVKAKLAAYGYDVSEMISSAPAQATGVTSTIPISTGKPAILNVEIKEGNLFINLGMFDRNFVDFAKTLPPNQRTYDSVTKIWGFKQPSKQVVEQMIQVLDTNFNTQKLKDILGQFQEKAKEEVKPGEQKSVKLRVRNIVKNTNGKWHVAFGFFRRGTKEGEMIKEIIKFMFPAYGQDGHRFVGVVPHESSPRDPSEEATIDEPKHATGYSEYLVRGDYNQYRQFSGVLEKYGFDNSEFNKIISELIYQQIVDVTRVEGDLEGFQSERNAVDHSGRKRIIKVNNIAVFDKALDGYKKKVLKDGKEIDFELYDLQKDGVAFLYGRNSALLGDATGVGKSLQLIVAADLRMHNQGGKTIVITLNSIQQQWVDEIKRFAKYNPEDVSVDPLNLSTWTVLTYTDFQVPRTREVNTRSIQSYVSQGQITCLLLDECQNIKNSGSIEEVEDRQKDGSIVKKKMLKGTARTAYIHSLVNFTDETTGQVHKIPHVWGASATIVANRPIDVYNQLRAVNHPLGRLGYKSFAKEFGAMVQGRFGLEDADVSEQVKAANKLKEWLINFKVFAAKTKEDIRKDMPQNIVENVPIEIDMDKLYQCINDKIEDYKKPDLPISIMIATRDCLASAKAMHSAHLAVDILRSGRKVMVFTAFRDAAMKIQYALQFILDNLGQGGKVLSILGGMKQTTKNEVIKEFKNPNSKIRALVLGIAAGGTGLDFPNVVEDVIENDFDWTPASTEQMRGRAHRISSMKPIKTKSIVAKDTPDEKFKAKVDNKIKIADIITKLTKEQVELFNRGKTRDDSRLKQIEQDLIKAVREQIEDEESDTSFQNEMAHDILEKLEIGGFKTSSKKNKNWYKKARRTHGT